MTRRSQVRINIQEIGGTGFQCFNSARNAALPILAADIVAIINGMLEEDVLTVQDNNLIIPSKPGK